MSRIPKPKLTALSLTRRHWSGIYLGAALLACLQPFAWAQESQRGVRPLDPIHIQRKIALVIGNQTYPDAPLKNPGNDAASIAHELETLGFDEVISKRDLTLRQMRAEIDGFEAKLRPGDFALFYYAGHGVQANEQNYLIPTDFAGVSEADLQYEAYPLAQVRDKMEASKARLRVLILDACRNNPFRTSRDGTKGLAPIASSVEGTYVAFATADNQTAADNPAERNGLFTKHLIEALQNPDLDLKQIFEKAKQDVYVASGQKQRPYTYDGVIGQFYFVNPTVTAVHNGANSSPADLAEREEIAFWSGIDKDDSESLNMYLKKYPAGRFAPLAQRNLDRLRTAPKSSTQAGATTNPIAGASPTPGVMDSRAIMERRQADAAFSRGQYYAAMPVYRQLADAGDSTAMAAIGTMYEKGGEGVPRDWTLAIQWHMKAANAGNSAAMQTIGLDYFSGDGGLTKDYEKAAFWLRKAADAGQIMAMGALGVLYRYGKGVPKDTQQAVVWLRKAAAAGDATAKQQLMEMGVR